MSPICIPHPHQSVPNRSYLINFKLKLDSGKPLIHILRSIYMIGTLSWTTPIPVQYKHWNRTISSRCSYHVISEPHHQSRIRHAHMPTKALSRNGQDPTAIPAEHASLWTIVGLYHQRYHTKNYILTFWCTIWAFHSTLSHELSRNDSHSLRHNPNSSC